MRKRNKILFVVSTVFILVSMLCVQSFAYISVAPDADEWASYPCVSNIPILSVIGRHTTVNSSGTPTSAEYVNFQFFNSGTLTQPEDYSFGLTDDTSYINRVTFNGAQYSANYLFESQWQTYISSTMPTVCKVMTSMRNVPFDDYNQIHFTIGSGVNMHSWLNHTANGINTRLPGAYFYVDRPDGTPDMDIAIRISYMYKDEDTETMMSRTRHFNYTISPIHENELTSYYNWTYQLKESLLSIPDGAIIVAGFVACVTEDGTSIDITRINATNILINVENYDNLYSYALEGTYGASTGLFSWIGDTIGGIFNVPLFYIDDLPISIGALFLAPLGIMTIIMVMKLFAGG